MENDRKRQQPALAGPYAMRIGRLADSLEEVSGVFLKLEGQKHTFTKDEIQEMFAKLEERVCANCDHARRCWGEDSVHTYQTGYEVLHAIEEHGPEMNIEMKRRLQKKCVMAAKFQRELSEIFHDAKQNMLWSNRLVKNRESCAMQLDMFAQMIKGAASELERSVFLDAKLEKKIRRRLQRAGIKALEVTFFLTEKGRNEIHLTAKAMPEVCVTTKELARMVSSVFGKALIQEGEPRVSVIREYSPYKLVEPYSFRMLYGVAKIGKDKEKISGDCFLETGLPGGREAVALSDGMGSGRKAFRESAMVIELLEKLLEAGFPAEMAIQMVNTALVMGREEIHFSTVDMSIFDLYTGECQFLKVGASTTFIRYRDKVERLSSTSLPIGVLNKLEIDSVTRVLRGGEFVVMMTDGVLDALPVVEQELLMETIVGGMKLVNPRKMAEYILNQVLEFTGEVPKDDMTVLVAGIWKSAAAGSQKLP